MPLAMSMFTEWRRWLGRGSANQTPAPVRRLPRGWTIRSAMRRLERAAAGRAILRPAEAAELIDLALSLSDARPALVELAARWLMRQGQPDRAARLLDRVARPTESIRMLRAAAQSLVGRRVEAEMDLRDWARESTCPSGARLLLAALQLEDGRRAEARATLTNTDDPQAGRWLDWLRLSTFADGETVAPAAADPMDAETRRLADQMVMNEALLPTLVFAATLNPHRVDARLLAAAIEAALPELEDQGAAREMLARLAAAMGDRERARQWIEVALEFRPRSATLALLLAELNDDDPDRARQLLRRAAEVHPDWPDLRRTQERLEVA